MPWFANQQIFFGYNYLTSDNRKICKAQFLCCNPILFMKSSMQAQRRQRYLRSAMCVASSKG